LKVGEPLNCGISGFHRAVVEAFSLQWCYAAYVSSLCRRFGIAYCSDLQGSSSHLTMGPIGLPERRSTVTNTRCVTSQKSGSSSLWDTSLDSRIPKVEVYCKEWQVTDI
jgi:hypothetical protein